MENTKHINIWSGIKALEGALNDQDKSIEKIKQSIKLLKNLAKNQEKTIYHEQIPKNGLEDRRSKIGAWLQLNFTDEDALDHAINRHESILSFCESIYRKTGLTCSKSELLLLKREYLSPPPLILEGASPDHRSRDTEGF